MIDLAVKVIAASLIMHSFYRMYNVLSLQVLFLRVRDIGPRDPNWRLVFKIKSNIYLLFREQRKQSYYAAISLFISFMIIVFLAFQQ